MKKQVRIILPKIKHDFQVQPAPCRHMWWVLKHQPWFKSIKQTLSLYYSFSIAMIHQSAVFALHCSCILTAQRYSAVWGESQEEAYIQVFQREDHGVGHKYAAWLLGYGSWQDVGVDSEGEVVFVQVPQPPQCGILRAEKLPQVFVEDKDQLRHTYSRNIAKKSVNCLLSGKRADRVIDILPVCVLVVICQSINWQNCSFTLVSRVDDKINKKLWPEGY